MALACCLPWMLPLFIPIFMFFWKPIYNALPPKQKQFVDDMTIMIEIWIHDAISKLKNIFGLTCDEKNNSCCGTSEVASPTNIQDERCSVLFKWNHGGRDVYIAYSGDDWSQKYKMHRSNDGFSLIMQINPGVYHYKFIVDNQWKCAPDQKHERDENGAYSNVLDVRSPSSD